MQSHITPISKPDQTIERWVPVAGYEGIYEVSSLGRVRSLDRSDSAGRPRTGKVLRQAINNGYPYVQLCKDAIPQVKLVHELVATAFLGERPKGYTVNHVDAVKTNNSADNLEYLTVGDNLRHAASLGLMGKLTIEQVWEVREAHLSNPALSYSVFAEKFDVSERAIYDLVRAKTYYHVANPDGSKAMAIPVRRGLKGIDVYSLHNSGRTMGSIARQYGVDTSTVSRAYHKAAACVESKARG